jgi:MFS transporter, DHA2 family, multidrug resistance protein
MHHNSGPFKVPDIRDFVPEKVKPWILFAFFIIFQFSGGVYMAAVAEMSGSLALMHEDILMAGFASLVGLGLTFTIMLRLKFLFSTRTSLITTASGLIVCNLIAMHTHSVPVLVAVSFVAGIFRMWGTFTCNSTIQLWVTPKRDMAVWFVYIQVCVQGFIYLTGLTTIYISFLTKWEYMHWFIIGALLSLILITFVAFRHYRHMPKLPLFGIDWMGASLWATTALSAIFVLNYGDYYNWYQSTEIWMGTVFALVALGLNLWRASFIRHPYISNDTWLFRPVWLTFLLFIVVEILISPSGYFERIYTEVILGYDGLHLVSLNWVVVVGTVLGAFFSYQVFALRKWKYKTMTLIGFSLLVGYLLVMYFIIDYNLPKEMLFFPVLLRAMAYIIIAITFISALMKVPFSNFWQSLTVQSFISASCGALVGESFLKQVFKTTMRKNEMLLGANLDNVNPLASHIPLDALFGKLQQHAMIISMKEIYGWLCILGILCLLAFLLNESTLRPKSLHPKFSTLRRTIKHELKMDKILNEDD